MHADIFTQLSLLLAIAVAISLIMRSLKQPLIVGHILTGILLGPSIFGFITSTETITEFGSFGIALLLFIVGLGLNPRVIKEVGRVAVLTGLGQVLFTSLFGFGLVKLLGYSNVAAFYIAVALTFSSTIIILKLLSDKKEQNKLHGKISIGFLLVQDIIATFALVVASATGTDGFNIGSLGSLALKGIGLGIAIMLVSKYVLTPLTGFLSRSQELLFLFAIAWGFGIATLFFKLGFSLEIGALVAGVALSTMTYAQEVGSRLRPLRDFFIVIFFIALGAGLDIGNVGAIAWQAIGLSIFVLVGNPIIVMTIMGLLGYTKKTSFKAGLAVAQISEFSLIFILLGQRTGQVDGMVVSLVTIVGIITIAVSSYMITYSDNLYATFEKYLTLFEKRKVKMDQESKNTYELILLGYKKGGHEFIKVFEKLKKKFVVIDYDPDVIDMLEKRKINYLYGDTTDIELLEEAGIDNAKLVVSTIGDFETNSFVVSLLEKLSPKTVVICRAENIEDAEKLYEQGASYVMMPHFIGSERISSFLNKNGVNKTEFKKYRERHLSSIRSQFFAESAEEDE
ncbi:MAG: cation:proton antiporter [Candidatus Saccharibacteria bacterium]|nr:cation:proton antiporter [Candidatus Saccharibacteria bacterium]